MSIKLDEKDNDDISKEYKWKELLYELFYEIKSEILGCKIEIEEEEYQENIKLITIPKLVEYIHDSIQILINKKIDDTKIELKEENDKFFRDLCLKKNIDLTLLTDEKKQYENIIKNLESKERILTKLIFKERLKKNALENKIGEYLQMEEEFEEMKKKLKYEEGRFLKNDRKDNEIIIIRGENSILKKSIKKLENQIKNLENDKQIKNGLINKLQNEIKQINLKKEELQKENEILSANSINININNLNEVNNQKIGLLHNNGFSSERSNINNINLIKNKFFPFQRIKNKFINNKNNSGDLLNNSRNESMEKTGSILLNKCLRESKISKNNIYLNNSSIKINNFPYGKNKFSKVSNSINLNKSIFNNKIKMNNMNVIKNIVYSSGIDNYNSSKSIFSITKKNHNKIINFQSKK